MKKPLLLAAISLAAILLLAGCGGGGSTAAVAGASAQQAAETEAAEVATATETNETAEESDLGGSLEADGTSGDKLPQSANKKSSRNLGISRFTCRPDLQYHKQATAMRWPGTIADCSR